MQWALLFPGHLSLSLLSTLQEDRPPTVSVTNGLNWADGGGGGCQDESLWGRKGTARTKHCAVSLSQVLLLDNHLTSLYFSLLICTKMRAVLVLVEPGEWKV